MKHFVASLALIAGVIPATMAVPTAAIAQEQSAYSQFVDAIASDRISDLSFETDMRTVFEAVWRQDADMATLEAECPGFIDGYITATRPILRTSHDFDWQWYRAEMLAIFQEGLSESEARGAARLFGSELGQRFLTVGIESQTVDAIVSHVLENEDEPVSEETYREDRLETLDRIRETMAPAEMRRFETQLGQATWFPALLGIQPKINALQLERANRDFTPEHGAEFDKVAQRYVDQTLETCDNPKK